jgi:outer membrane protein, heavy metal efflux system
MKRLKINSLKMMKSLFKLIYSPRSVIVICLTMALFFMNNVQGQDSLNRYLTIAAENNPGLKAKFNQYLAAMQKVPQVGSLPDPSFAFGYFIMPVETRVGAQQAKFSLTQAFPWFGLLNSRKDVATEAAKVKFEMFEQSKSSLFWQIRHTYYALYNVQESIDITLDNIDILETLKQLAIVKFESGLASIVDELRVEMELADLVNDLAYFNDTKAELTVTFNNLLNRDRNAEIFLPETLWRSEIGFERQAIMDSVENGNHLIKQIEHKIMAWNLQETVAKKSGLPNFIVGTDYTIVNKRPGVEIPGNGTDAWIIKAGITLPVYRGKYNAMVQEAQLEMKAAGFEKEDQINQLSSLLEQGFKDLNDAERRLDLYVSQLRLARQSLNILTAQYSADGNDFEEVLRMERKLLFYALELEKARSQNEDAIAFIQFLMGI